jgi:hypothetical protein
MRSCFQDLSEKRIPSDKVGIFDRPANPSGAQKPRFARNDNFTFAAYL